MSRYRVTQLRRDANVPDATQIGQETETSVDRSRRRQPSTHGGADAALLAACHHEGAHALRSADQPDVQDYREIKKAAMRRFLSVDAVRWEAMAGGSCLSLTAGHDSQFLRQTRHDGIRTGHAVQAIQGNFVV